MIGDAFSLFVPIHLYRTLRTLKDAKSHNALPHERELWWLSSTNHFKLSKVINLHLPTLSLAQGGMQVFLLIPGKKVGDMREPWQRLTFNGFGNDGRRW